MAKPQLASGRYPRDGNRLAVQRYEAQTDKSLRRSVAQVSAWVLGIVLDDYNLFADRVGGSGIWIRDGQRWLLW